jgi:hypothetical protein
MKTIKYFLFITAFPLVSEITIFAQPPSYLPTNGLVAWYPFNGNANDESGNGRNLFSTRTKGPGDIYKTTANATLRIVY